MLEQQRHDRLADTACAAVRCGVGVHVPHETLEQSNTHSGPDLASLVSLLESFVAIQIGPRYLPIAVVLHHGRCMAMYGDGPSTAGESCQSGKRPLVWGTARSGATALLVLLLEGWEMVHPRRIDRELRTVEGL